MGKRYICNVCKAEVVVTKAGTGTLQCHSQPMALK
ncbi:MAG: desulfoferrodoxin [Chloroflexi bacterium]|nr:desulfoferrodoxin [Chloroflexota bacterium]